MDGNAIIFSTVLLGSFFDLLVSHTLNIPYVKIFFVNLEFLCPLINSRQS